MTNFVVDTLDDVVADDVHTSLREAVDAANASAGLDTISFSPGLAGVIRLVNGTLTVSDALTINGNLDGHGRPEITISGDVAGDDTHVSAVSAVTDVDATITAGTFADNVRLFDVAAVTDVTIDGLILTGGQAVGVVGDRAADGGAIRGDTASSIVVNHSLVAGNRADGNGGAIAGDSVAANDATISDNRAGNQGGGAFGATDVTLDRVTVSGNTAGAEGGGVYAHTATLLDATLSGNATGMSGGGVFGVAVDLNHVTASGNQASDGGGAIFSAAALSVSDSILLANTASIGAEILSVVTVDITGKNIIGASPTDFDPTAYAGVVNAAVGDVFADTAGGAGVLADNGGNLLTIALKASGLNPAVDASSGGDIPSIDELGVSSANQFRIGAEGGDGVRDLGAVELGPSLNNAPQIEHDLVFQVAEGSTSRTLIGVIAHDVDGDQIISSITGGNDSGLFVASGDSLYLGNLGDINGLAHSTAALGDADVGEYQLTINVKDALGGTDTETVRVIVTPVDDPVAVAHPVHDQLAIAGNVFNFQLPSDTFADPDGGPSFSLTASLADDSPLPSWLAFNESTGTFIGDPAASDLGTLHVKVTATQGADTASDTFDVVVAQSASLVVTTAADVVDPNDGVTSLREALMIANADPAGDPSTQSSITFAHSLAGATIVLTQGALVVDGNVKIDGDVLGDTAGKTTGRADDITITVADNNHVLPSYLGTVGDSRIFEVRGDGTHATFNGLTLTGAGAYTSTGVAPAIGPNPGGFGAAIYQADGSYGWRYARGQTDLGWPVYTSNPNYILPVVKTSVTVTNSEISNNFGAAVLGGYRTTIQDSIMSGNDGAFGAAVTTGAADGIVTLRNVDVVHNTLKEAATTLGTAAPNSSFHIYDSLISDNRVVDRPNGQSPFLFSAGAIGTGSPGGEIKIVHSEISDNQGVMAGGIATGSPSVKISIEDSLFQDNTGRGDRLAGFSGGAVAIASNSVDLYVKNSDFVGNTNALLGAGGIAVGGTPNIVDIAGSTFFDNTSAAGGGALYFGGVSNKVSVVQSTIVDNQLVTDPIGPGSDLTLSPHSLAYERGFYGVPRVAGGILANVADGATAFFGGSYGTRIVNTVVAGNTVDGVDNDLALTDDSALIGGTGHFAFFANLTRDPITGAVVFPADNNPIARPILGVGGDLILFNDNPDLTVQNNLIGTGVRDSFGALVLDDGVKNNLVGTPGSPLDPLLAAPFTAADGRLVIQPLSASPLVDAGDNSFLGGINTAPDGKTSGSLDQAPAGNPRIADGNGDGSRVVDIGAAEFAPLVINDSASHIAGGAIAIVENLSAVTRIIASGADHFAITGGSDAVRFAIDPVSGALTFIAAPDFEAPTDTDHNNIYNVTVTASTELSTDARAIAVIVTNAPVITITGTNANNVIDASHGMGTQRPTNEEDVIKGLGGNDTINALGGNDTVSGGTGKDTMTGGSGKDQFLFDAALNASTNVDRINDFAHGSDSIALKHAIFAAAGHTGTLAAAAFFAGTAAHDASDRVIYNPSNGFLTYDVNGNHAGGATHFATLAAHLHLTNADFVVV